MYWYEEIFYPCELDVVISMMCKINFALVAKSNNDGSIQDFDEREIKLVAIWESDTSEAI